jgi:hypothetical protein
MSTVAGDGKERTKSFVSARALPMWLATITVRKIKAGLPPPRTSRQRSMKTCRGSTFATCAQTAASGLRSAAGNVDVAVRRWRAALVRSVCLRPPRSCAVHRRPPAWL